MRNFACPGCGVIFRYDEQQGGTVLREQYGDAAPGRVTFNVRGTVVHRCADGEYLPPDQIAGPLR
jgi:hypothetical protein